ncbi:sensor histidine kinase [Paenibacillus sp. CAU 1782]
MFNKPIHWLDYVAIFIRLFWALTRIIALHGSIGADNGGLWALCACGFLLSAALPFFLYLKRGVSPLAVSAVELLLTGGLYFLLPDEMNQNILVFFQVPFLTFGYLCRRSNAFGITVGLFFVASLGLGQLSAIPWETALEESVNLLLFAGIGFCFRKLVAANRTIQQQNATLQIYAKQIERLTLTEERNRLSRDLHDTVGHNFTAAIIGMDAILYLMDAAPEEAKLRLRELLKMMRAGLDEVRRHIHAIAPNEAENQPLSAALYQIGNEFHQHTGMKVELEVIGLEKKLSEMTSQFLIRFMQESLTNAMRHGQASHTGVKLFYEADMLTITVTDDGLGFQELVKGFGLEAMERRAANLNGMINISSNPGGGITLTCKVPIQ